MCCGCYEKWILVWPNFFIAASFFLLDVLFFVATWSLFYKTRLLIKKLTPIYELKLPEKSQLIFEFSRYLAFLWFWISEFNWLFGLSDFIAAILMASADCINFCDSLQCADAIMMHRLVLMMDRPFFVSMDLFCSSAILSEDYPLGMGESVRGIFTTELSESLPIASWGWIVSSTTFKGWSLNVEGSKLSPFIGDCPFAHCVGSTWRLDRFRASGIST